MKQTELQLTGGNNNGSRRALDFYPTPPDVTIALMDFLKLEKSTIWECACGNNAMSEVLEKYGHTVIATDISSGVDFLKESKVCDAIITNPPSTYLQILLKKQLKKQMLLLFFLRVSIGTQEKGLVFFMKHPRAMYYLSLGDLISYTKKEVKARKVPQQWR